MKTSYIFVSPVWCSCLLLFLPDYSVIVNTYFTEFRNYFASFRFIARVNPLVANSFFASTASTLALSSVLRVRYSFAALSHAATSIAWMVFASSVVVFIFVLRLRLVVRCVSTPTIRSYSPDVSLIPYFSSHNLSRHY